MKTPKIAEVLLCLSVVAACDDAANDPVESSDRELLFDMELEDVLTLHGDFAPEMDEGEFVDAFSAPFQCSAFGHICEEMGEEGALDFIQQTSELG